MYVEPEKVGTWDFRMISARIPDTLYIKRMGILNPLHTLFRSMGIMIFYSRTSGFWVSIRFGKKERPGMRHLEFGL